MLDHLRRFSPKLASDLGDHLAQPDRLRSAQQVHLLFGSGQITEKARGYFEAPVAAWETRRNLLVFAPIVWTWLTIAVAGLLFQRAVTEARSVGPDAVARISFIAEWGRGFGWQVAGFSLFTFPNTAFISAVLVLVVAFLTVRLRKAERCKF